MSNKRKEELNAHELKIKLIREASESLNAYNNLLHTTANLEKNLNFIQEQRKTLKTQIKELDLEIANTNDINEKKALITKQAVKKLERRDLKERIKLSEKELEIRKDAIKSVKTHAVVLKDMLVTGKKISQTLYDQRYYWLEQEKSVRNTEIQMGVLSNQANGFRDNIYKTSINTSKIGIQTKELAELQGRYSDNIGRSVQLTEDQLSAMAELSKGTILNTDGAAELASEMEKFNISARGSVNFVENMLSTANKMGVSSGKAIKNLQKNFALAQKYNFKGGVEGISKMVVLATKFKLEMQDVANFAENIMTPEGAVEAAAKLQVLGGAWSKLGDPFELMYRSRNDMAGLTEDIINATKATAKFDDVTGQVTIDPMEMHRLREVANATGMSFESLANSAREAAKFTKIESGISDIFSKDDKEFISGLASFNEKTKEFEVTMQVGNDTVTESVNSLQRITPEIVKTQQDYQENLKKRARESMTFNERFDALVNTFKSGLLPAFTEVSKILENVIDGVSPFVTSVAKLLAEWPKTTATIAGVGTAIALIGKEALWIARGMNLGIGFNRVASVNGGAGTGGAGGSGWRGKLKSGGKAGAKFGGKMGALGGITTGLLSGYNEWSENSEAGMSTNENLGRSLLVGGGGILGGAAMGAAMGALGGPLAPITVPLGAIFGGVLGSMGGDMLGDLINGDNKNSSFGVQQDFISRPNQDAVPFSSKDTLIGAKPDGPIDKILNNSGVATPGNNDKINTTSLLIKTIENSNKITNIENQKTFKNSSSNKVSVDFNKPLKIEGSMNLKLGNQSVKIDLNDPFLIRELSKVIQKELTSAISGGKISSNPVLS